MKTLLFLLITLNVVLYGETSPKQWLDSVLVYKESDPNLALKFGFDILTHSATELPDLILSRTHHEIGWVLNNQGLPVQAMNYYISSLDYLIRAGFYLESGWLHNSIGNIYFGQKMYDQALEKYITARELFTQTGNPCAEATIVNNMALIAKANGDYEKAVALFNEALNIRNSYCKKSYLIAHSYKYIGDLYWEQGQITEAMNYYQRVLDIGVTKGEGNIWGLSLQSMGEIYFQQGKTNNAIKYFKQAEDCFISKFNPEYLTKLYLQMSDIHIKEEQADSAKQILNKAMTIAENYGLLDQHIGVLSRLINVSTQTGDMAKSISYYQQLNALREYRHESEQQKSLERSEVRLELSDYKAKLMEEKLRLINAKRQRNFASLIGGFILVMAWMIYRKLKQNQLVAKQRKALHQQAIDIERTKTLQKDSEIKAKKNELLTKATFIQQKNDLIEKITQELKYAMSLLKSQENQHPFKDILNTLEDTKTSESHWQEFERQFTGTYPGLLKALARQFPHLTAVDMKMCAYLNMNMNTKEIAKLTGLTTRAIEVRRHRLRKKLNIEKGKDLVSFLKTFG